MAGSAEEQEDSRGPDAPASRGVFFRKAFLVQEMFLHPDDKLIFDGVGERAASVDLVNMRWDDKQRWWRSPSVRCTGTLRWEMPRRAVSLFKALWLGKVPDEIDPRCLLLNGEQWSASPDPVFRDRCAPAFLNDALAPVEAEIEHVVARVVGLTRWRCNRTGPVDLPPLGFLEWSLDGVIWKLDVRRPTIPSATCGPDLVLSDVRRADIKGLLDAGEHEPLHQSLFREAVSLLESNPRSALAIGATAAEVAVKAMVSKLSPQTSWLVQNVASPPIAKILDEYLPILLPPGSPRIAPNLIKNLRVAVLLRNELVHGAQANIEPLRISSAFGTFQDVVWLCDYFSGMPWAANRVSQSTRVAMNLPTTVDTKTAWFVD